MWLHEGDTIPATQNVTYGPLHDESWIVYQKNYVWSSPNALTVYIYLLWLRTSCFDLCWTWSVLIRRTPIISLSVTYILSNAGSTELNASVPDEVKLEHFEMNTNNAYATKIATTGNVAYVTAWRRYYSCNTECSIWSGTSWNWWLLWLCHLI